MIHHPSRRFKAIASFVAAISVLGLIGLAVNSLVIDSWLVGSLCFAMLLFGVNMLITLTARYVMKRTMAWPDKGRGLVAFITALMFCMLLLIDYPIASWITFDDDSSGISSILTTLLTAIIWVSAYSATWESFIKQKKNLYISSAVTLGFGLASFTLFIYSLIANELFDGTGWKTQFSSFALACMSLATAISAFMVQSDNRKIMSIKEKAESGAGQITIREFDPANDMANAESLVAKDLKLDRFADGTLESWLNAKDVVCEAIAQSSHLYGAYLDDELAGMLFIDKVGADKPYARSSHAWFHAFVQTLDKILFKTVDSLDDAENRLVMSLDPKPNARIALMAVSSELAKLNIADKLFGALEKDLAGCRIVYCSYGDEQHQAFVDNRYEPVASSVLREKSDSVENEFKLTLYMKNLRESVDLIPPAQSQIK